MSEGLPALGSMDVSVLEGVDMTHLTAGEHAGKTAVLMCHGMGQQVRWHTLTQIVDSLRQLGAVKSVSTRLARFEDDAGEMVLGRVDVVVKTPSDALRELHVYEAYWAPITEGRVTLRDVVVFLKDAAVRGIRHAWKPFIRFMFGRPYEFRKTPWVALPLASVLAVFLALVSLNAVIAAVSAQGIYKWAQGTLVGNEVTQQSAATLVVAMVEVIALAYLLVTFAVAGYRTRRRRTDPAYAVGSMVQGALRALLAGVGVVTIAAGVALPWVLSQGVPNVVLPRVPSPVTAVVWGIAAWLASRTRGMLVQYVGDVVAYVSSFQVSRFDEIRDKIQAVARRVVCAVYQSGGYGTHVVVGHSLGSVVAYEAMNAAIARDRWQPGLGMSVVERTSAFITFGSPLDKIAFIFRTQSTDGDVREALASQVQPLISEQRRPRWINIYSPQDPISGSLDFYDDPADNAPRVENVQDQQADLQLWAHTQYWGNPELAQTVLSVCAPAQPVP